MKQTTHLVLQYFEYQQWLPGTKPKGDYGNFRKYTLLQHLSKMHGLPAEERLESRSNTFQANALTIRPVALSSRGGLKFSTPTTTITSRHYQPSCSGSQHKGRMPSFTAVCFHSSSPRQVPGLVASPKCQWRSSVASTLHQTRICL